MKQFLTYSICGVSIVLLSGCSTAKDSEIVVEAVPQETAYTNTHVLPEKEDGLAHVASFYASISCMVADQNFGERNGYADTTSIYTAYGYEDRLLLRDYTKIYADQEEFTPTFFRYLNELCPGRISPKQQGDIAEQLRRDAL